MEHEPVADLDDASVARRLVVQAGPVGFQRRRHGREPGGRWPDRDAGEKQRVEHAPEVPDPAESRPEQLARQPFGLLLDDRAAIHFRHEAKVGAGAEVVVEEVGGHLARGSDIGPTDDQ